jgi:hypothetical protein
LRRVRFSSPTAPVVIEGTSSTRPAALASTIVRVGRGLRSAKAASQPPLTIRVLPPQQPAGEREPLLVEPLLDPDLVGAGSGAGERRRQALADPPEVYRQGRR